MKKFLAMFLAIIMVLGTIPMLALVSSADPIKLGGYIAAAGFGFEFDSMNGTYQIPYDFDLSGDEWTEIVTNDPEIVPKTMGDNAEDYLFTLSLTAGGETEIHDVEVVDIRNFDNWSPRDYGLVFGLADFSLVNDTTYDVRIDIITPDGAEYYVEEAGIKFYFPDLQDGSGTIDGTNITWVVDAETRTLTVDGTGVIPAYSDLESRPWHEYSTGVAKIVIGDGITGIGDIAFNTFKMLDVIILGEYVETLGFDCFAHSGTISYVYLPTTMTSISQGAFYSCTVKEVECDLTSRDFGEQCSMGAYNTAITNATWVNDPDWGSFGDMSDTVQWAFDADTATLTISGTGAIPQPTTKPWQSFVSQIEAVVIEDGLTEIPGGGLFSHLDKLDYVEMPESIVKIGGDAFAYNGTISYMVLSSNVTSISQGVLYASTVTTISCKKDWRAIQQQASVGAYNTAFGSAEWVDTEIYGTNLSFTRYSGGTGIENWKGNNDPEVTQILICPKWDGVWDNDFYTACKNTEWEITLDDGTYVETTHLYPRSIYNAGDWGILRFVPALATDPAERIYIEPGVEYTITVKFTYKGITETVTSADKFVLAADKETVTFENYYSITWQINGETEYVDSVPEGFKPVYHGAAESYAEDGIAYVYTIPATVAAEEDTVYNITLEAKDMTVGTLGLWGDGYENWTGSPNIGDKEAVTQLLLRPKDWAGNDLTEDAKNYNWTITIDGVDYEVGSPVTNYSNWIFRFEPCLWDTPFVPKAGKSYEVGVTIYDEDGDLYFTTGEPTTITIADDFVAVYDGPEPGIPGDLNGDNEVTIEDVTTLLNHLAAVVVEYVEEMDLDEDGEITISDVTALLNILAGVA